MPKLLVREKSASLGIFLVLLILLLSVVLSLQTAANPEMGFLPPSFSSGHWMLAPIELSRVDEGLAAMFRKDFVVPDGAGGISSALVMVTAARSYELRLNGQVRSGPSERGLGRNWKVPQEFDLTDGLLPGPNRLEILVWNTVRPPALRVSGLVNSDATWRVWSLSQTQQATPQGMPPPRDWFPGQWSERAADPYRRLLQRSARVAAYAVLAMAIFFYITGARPTGWKLAGTSRFRKWILAVLLIALYFPMAVIRDPGEGWDADGHIDYLRYVASGRGVLMPDEGWERFQPPIYYWIAAALYRAVLPCSAVAAGRWQLASSDFLSLKAVQLLTPLFMIVQIVLVLKIIRYLFPRPEGLAPSTVAFVALLPMQIYFSPFISNEVFSSLAITAALFLLIFIVREKRFRIGPSVALGSAVGLACLSKYSGFLLALTACFAYAVFFVAQVERRTRLIVSFLTASLVFIAFTGPYYLRNVKKYGELLPVNVEFQKGFTIEYFDLPFVLDPSRAGLGAVDKFVSRASSFIDGNYSSMWIDSGHYSKRWTRPFEVAIYYLAIFPTVLIGAGFLRAIASCRDSENGRAYLAIAAIFIFAVFSYLFFILRFGSFEIVKAFYVLSQVGPLAVFFELGQEGVKVGGWQKSAVFSVAVELLYTAITSYYLLVPFLIGKGL